MTAVGPIVPSQLARTRPGPAPTRDLVRSDSRAGDRPRIKKRVVQPPFFSESRNETRVSKREVRSVDSRNAYKARVVKIKKGPFPPLTSLRRTKAIVSLSFCFLFFSPYRFRHIPVPGPLARADGARLLLPVRRHGAGVRPARRCVQRHQTVLHGGRAAVGGVPVRLAGVAAAAADGHQAAAHRQPLMTSNRRRRRRDVDGGQDVTASVTRDVTPSTPGRGGRTPVSRARRPLNRRDATSHRIKNRDERAPTPSIRPRRLTCHRTGGRAGGNVAEKKRFRTVAENAFTVILVVMFVMVIVYYCFYCCTILL